MPNTHSIPDSFYESMATWGDLGPAVVIAQSGFTVPASSMTLPAVAVTAYVRDSTQLVYAVQAAISLTLSGSNGTYWIAIHRDLSTAVSGWTRRAGSHLIWQFAGTQPADPVAALVVASVTVAGGVITGVTVLSTPTSQPMSKQLAGAVAITGGTATVHTLTTLANVNAGLTVTAQTGCSVPDTSGDNRTAYYSNLNATGGTGRYALNMDGTAPSRLGGTLEVAGLLGLGVAPNAGAQVNCDYPKTARYGLYLHPTDSDAGANAPIVFVNVGYSAVGSITTNATSTAYNTSSDARLKHSIQPLTDALATLLALRPVAFRWHADDSPDEGFLAHELQVHIPHAVTGEPDQVHEDGSIKPQQVDHSKLVVWLTAALQDTVAQLTAVTARVQALEEALGV